MAGGHTLVGYSHSVFLLAGCSCQYFAGLVIVVALFGFPFVPCLFLGFCPSSYGKFLFYGCIYSLFSVFFFGAQRVRS